MAGRCRLLPSNEQCPSHCELLPSNEQHPSLPSTAPLALPRNLRLSPDLRPTSASTAPSKDRGEARTLMWSIMSCFCAYKREQSGHLKTDTFWFSMCWSKWRYSRVCRVNTVSHMEHLYIILKQKKEVQGDVSQPSSLRPKAPPLHIQEFRRQMHTNTVKRTNL